MWILMALLFFQTTAAPCPPSPCQQGPDRQPDEHPSLVVQVTDPVDAPIAGAEVIVRPAGARRPVKKTRSGVDGFARFWVRPENGDVTYTIEVKEFGFKTQRIKDVHIPSSRAKLSTTSLQVRLEIKPAEVTVY